jgi:MFS family permease
MLSIFLIIGQIFGGSLAGGIVGGRIDDVDGYRLAYDAFAAVAVLAALLTGALASRARERRSARSAPES